jgi:hypothetical protein
VSGGVDPVRFVVEITPKEIYDAVVELTGRVNVLIEQGRETRTDVADHEERLRSLERARWPLPALSVLIALAALGWNLFGGR